MKSKIMSTSCSANLQRLFKVFWKSSLSWHTGYEVTLVLFWLKTGVLVMACQIYDFCRNVYL